jgi:hypothetical protein
MLRLYDAEEDSDSGKAFDVGFVPPFLRLSAQTIFIIYSDTAYLHES